MLGPRNRELLGLIPSALLVTAGFTAIFIQTQNKVSGTSLTYGGAFLALCLATHIVIRRVTPHADPYLFPLAAVLASVGIVELYAISINGSSAYAGVARQQGEWLAVGLICFTVTIVALRDGRYMQLENYRYLIAIAGVVALFLPRLPVIGQQVNGAYLSVHVGSLSFEPSEFAKIAIVVFLASYLRDNRQLLVTAGRRVLGVTLPPMKQFGPLMLVWGSAMAMLIVTREIGTSLMFFGAFLALLYVATGRLSFPILGLILFAAGAYYLGTHVAHIYARVLDWEHPFEPSLYKAVGGSGQLAQGLFSQADGGIVGIGFAQSLVAVARADTAKRHDLLGHHQRNGPARCDRPARGVRALRRARPEDRDPRARLVLEAPGDGSRVHRRAAGLRDRRRRHGPDPADRGDAPVRRLRRILGRDELRPARAVAARVRPRAATDRVRLLAPPTRREALDRRRDRAQLAGGIALEGRRVDLGGWQAMELCCLLGLPAQGQFVVERA